jgi:phage FluMu gp28-like protein
MAYDFSLLCAFTFLMIVQRGGLSTEGCVGMSKYTYHSRFIPKGVAEALVKRLSLVRVSKYSSETHTFYQTDLAMKNAADVTGDNRPSWWLIAV